MTRHELFMAWLQILADGRASCWIQCCRLQHLLSPCRISLITAVRPHKHDDGSQGLVYLPSWLPSADHSSDQLLPLSG